MAISAQVEQFKAQAVEVIASQPGIHAKALEEALDIGDGSERTSLGDKLYRAMKADTKTFKKPVKGAATWDLTPAAKRARSKAAKVKA